MNLTRGEDVDDVHIHLDHHCSTCRDRDDQIRHIRETLDRMEHRMSELTDAVDAALARLAVVIDRRASVADPEPVLPDVPAPLMIQVTTTNDTLWVELTCPL